MPNDTAQRKREARIRYRMLAMLHDQRGNHHGGWVTGRGIVDALVWCGTDYRLDEDQDAIDLLRDLVNKDFAEEEDNREDRDQPFGLDHLTWRITAKGSSFINRALPADAEIDDGRILK
ncbi:MAG: hypothetical protein AAGF84_03825 [Planctomycetota bacterium]